MVENHSSEKVLPRLVLEDAEPLLGFLRTWQEFFWRKPGLVAALIQALVAEGRQFAATPEGENWMQALENSQIIQQGRMVWQAYGLDNLAGNNTGQLPSAWLSHLVEALQSADLEETLTQIMMEDITIGSVSIT